MLQTIAVTVLAVGGLSLFIQAARSLRRRTTGYGWDCPDCLIRAGHPDDAFASHRTAGVALNEHVETTHQGAAPAGAGVVEIVLR